MKVNFGRTIRITVLLLFVGFIIFHFLSNKLSAIPGAPCTFDADCYPGETCAIGFCQPSSTASPSPTPDPCATLACACGCTAGVCNACPSPTPTDPCTTLACACGCTAGVCNACPSPTPTDPCTTLACACGCTAGVCDACPTPEPSASPDYCAICDCEAEPSATPDGFYARTTSIYSDRKFLEEVDKDIKAIGRGVQGNKVLSYKTDNKGNLFVQLRVQDKALLKAKTAKRGKGYSALAEKAVVVKFRCGDRCDDATPCQACEQCDNGRCRIADGKDCSPTPRVGQPACPNGNQCTGAPDCKCVCGANAGCGPCKECKMPGGNCQYKPGNGCETHADCTGTPPRNNLRCINCKCKCNVHADCGPLPACCTASGGRAGVCGTFDRWGRCR